MGQNEYFSIKDFFNMPEKDLEDYIFQLKEENIVEENSLKFVQAKKKMLKLDDGKKIKVLQIIDISNQIMYERAKGDKKLLTLINATVSHEMRNPINAIISQNLIQK